jgi:hypothetical protein
MISETYYRLLEYLLTVDSVNRYTLETSPPKGIFKRPVDVHAIIGEMETLGLIRYVDPHHQNIAIDSYGKEILSERKELERKELARQQLQDDIQKSTLETNNIVKTASESGIKNKQIIKIYKQVNTRAKYKNSRLL